MLLLLERKREKNLPRARHFGGGMSAPKRVISLCTETQNIVNIILWRVIWNPKNNNNPHWTTHYRWLPDWWTLRVNLKMKKKNEIKIKLLIVIVYLSCRLYICQYLILFSLNKKCILFFIYSHISKLSRIFMIKYTL